MTIQTHTADAMNSTSTFKASASARNLSIGIALGLLAVASAYFAIPSATASINLQSDVAIRDLGTVRQGAALETTFTLTNRGRSPVQLLAVSKSCTCTRVNVAKTHLDPGESSALNVTVNVGTNRHSLASEIGVAYRDLGFKLGGDSVKPAMLRLRVTAIVSPDVECDPEMLTFPRPSSTRREVRVFSHWLRGGLIKQVHARHRAFSVKASPVDNRVEVSFDPSLWPIDESPSTELVIVTPSKVDPNVRVPIRVLALDRRDVTHVRRFDRSKSVSSRHNP